MKKHPLLNALLLSAITLSAFGENQSTNAPVSIASAVDAKSDADVEKKTAALMDSFTLEDSAKAARVKEILRKHLKSVRDWHNEHPANTVPAGINPTTGKTLSELDREVIADSAMPKSVHENLMTGLRKNLNAEQVEAILDKYTVGKVAFTMKGYQAIVPDMTKEEEATILAQLQQAREEAVDYKNMNEISAIFKIHKTRIEQYLNANGRNWKVIYKAYVDSLKAKKSGGNTPAIEP